MTQSLASYFQHRAFVLKSLVLSLLVLGSFISGVGEVRAVTFGYDDGWGEKATFVANLNKTSYMPGEAITLSGSTYFEPACTNAIWGGTIYATLNGQTITAFNSLLNAFGYTYFSVVAFTAPTTPGTYMINVSGCISMCTSGNLWFTVLPANYGQSCASAGNACGQVNWGTIQANGACSVSAAPANPVNLGWGCNSAPNSCGQVNTGAIQCNGMCSAGVPANPAGYGNACSAANSCGQTNAGSIQCNGSCSATAPSESGCYACVGTVPSNATVFSGENTTNLGGNTPYTYSTYDSGNKCEYACNAGFILSGGSCIRPQCSNSADDIDTEDTLIDMADPGCASPSDNDEIDLPPKLTVDKRMVEQNTQVIITWVLNGQTGCILTGNGLNTTVSADSDTTQTINGRTTFTLTCPSGADSVTVEVVPKGFET